MLARTSGARAVTALLAVGLAAVAACGGDGAPVSGTATDPIASAEHEGDEGGSAPSRADTVGVLRFGYPSPPSQGLDPHRSSQSQDTTWLAPIYDPLIIEMPDSSLVPGLATSWEFVDDGAALELTLREGVTFHDGASFDADVVKANIERGKQVEGSAIAPLLAVIEEVEVVDTYKVRLHLSGPAATLPRVLADRPGMMISPASLDDPDLANNPVGAGMYRLVEWRPGDRAEYAPFEDYWNPEWNQLEQLHIIQMSDSATRLNALRSGELDLAGLDATQFLDAQDSAELVTETFPSAGTLFMQLNRTRAAFDDVRVRQALNHAVDRDALVSAVLFDLARPSAQFYPPEMEAGHVEGYDDRYPYDPERARELLAEAGLADGFSFELVVPTSTQFQSIGQVLQASFAEIGVTANLRSVDPGNGGNLFYTQKVGDALLAPYPGRTDPSMTAQLFFTAEAHSNPDGHTIPSIDEAYTASLEALPDDERIPRLQELMKVIIDEAAIVILAQSQNLVARSPAVSGFHWSLRGQPDFRGTTVIGS